MHSTCIHPSCHVSPFIIPSHSLNQPTHASTFLPSDFQHCTCIPLTISAILAVLHMHSLNLAVMFPLPSIHLPIKTIHTSHNIHSHSFTHNSLFHIPEIRQNLSTPLQQPPKHFSPPLQPLQPLPKPFTPSNYP